MSYLTLEVDLENGWIHPRGAELLPAKARALLTILVPAPEPALESIRTLGEAMRELSVIGDATHTDLSTNKAHFDDLGR